MPKLHGLTSNRSGSILQRRPSRHSTTTTSRRARSTSNRHHRELLERIENSAIAQYTAGRASQQDPIEVRAHIMELELERLMLETQRRAAVAMLNRLLRRRVDAELPPPPARLAVARSGEPRRVHPRQLAASARIRARQAEADEANLAFYPNFEVMGSYDSMWDIWEHPLIAWFTGSSASGSRSEAAHVTAGGMAPDTAIRPDPSGPMATGSGAMGSTNTGSGTTRSATGLGSGSEISYYTCSMHPAVHSHEPGKCPICSMDLTPVTREEEQAGVIHIEELLDYNLSVAVWSGMIALAGLDAETGVVMLLYLTLAHRKWRAEGRLRTRDDLREAIVEGAAHRIRPKLMTVLTMLIGLIPVLWSTGTGADVMKRIAAPMVGGLVTSFVLELLVYPAIFAIWKHRELPSRNGLPPATATPARE